MYIVNILIYFKDLMQKTISFAQGLVEIPAILFLKELCFVPLREMGVPPNTRFFDHLKYFTPDSNILRSCSPYMLTATEVSRRSECAILPNTRPSGLVIPSMAR